ncbi:MAG TPA: molybdate ABC transporter permease subunit [Methylophilaceae bacterium]|nr:molybdate ABC transporter permease subunit [Methylophilaceae bacterium]
MLATLFNFSTAELAALALSLKVAVFCTLAVAIPGVMVAWILARKSFYGKALLDGVVHLPLVLPPVVPGFLLLMLLGRNGPLGGWLHTTFGIDIAFTWIGAVIASAVMAFPLMVRASRLAISQVDHGLEIAAHTLGATPLRTFFTVTLPLSLPGILTGLILAFSRSLGEFGATITFVGNIEGKTRTLPLAIYTYTQVPGGDWQALRLVVLSILIALVALLASELLERQARKRITGQATS